MPPPRIATCIGRTGCCTLEKRLGADDQSIAGLIMAVEQSLVMGIAIVVLFVRALAESEREQQRRERYEIA